MNKFILLLVLVSVFVGINANKKRDPCYFNTNDAYLPSELKACFRKIPLNHELKRSTLSIINLALKTHPYADILPKFDFGIDVFQELKRIEKTHYKSDFKFHRDLALMYQHFPDTSSYYSPPEGYRVFYGRLPFILTADGSSNKIIANPNPRFTFPVPKETYGKEVVAVDGVHILEFLNNVFYFPSTPLSGNVNYFLLSGADAYTYYYGSYIKQDYQTWKFADGSTYELGVHIQTGVNITSTAALKELNAKSAPTNKRGESPKVKTVTNPKERIAVKASDEKPASKGCTYVTSNKASDESVITGIANCKGNEVPYLIINFFPNATAALPFRNSILEYVNAIADRKSPFAFIDISYAGDNSDITVVEWAINVLSGTYVQPYSPQDAYSKSYRTLYSARTTSQEAKELLYSLYSTEAIDPATALPFHDPHCISEAEEESHKVGDIYHPAKPPKYVPNYGYEKDGHEDKDGEHDKDSDRENDNYDENDKKRNEPAPPRAQHFAPRFYLGNNNDFLDLPTFSTKYLISFSGFACFGRCGIFPNVLRQTNKAKLYGIGGVNDVDFQLSYSYAGPSLSWELDIVPTFPLDSDFFNFSSSALLVHPLLESYLTDLNVPEVLRGTVADDVIEWNVVNPASTPIDFFTHMFINSDVEAKVLDTAFFKPQGACYAKNSYEEYKDK